MSARRSLWLVMPLALASACAGRNPIPTATVQPQDSTSNCTMVTAELAANQRRSAELDSESTGTIVGNVALGVVGVALFPPLLFAMDLRNAAATERDSLNQRNAFLSTLQTERCAPGAVIVASRLPGSVPSTPASSPPLVTTTAARVAVPVESGAAIGARGAAVAALAPDGTAGQTLEQYVQAVRTECRQQRRRNCDAAVEAAIVDYDRNWQAQSRARARMR